MRPHVAPGVAPEPAGAYPPGGRIWFFVGRPGMGKSTTARIWVEALLAADPRAIAIIHDPHGDGEAGKAYPGMMWPSIAAFRAAPRLVERRNVFRRADPLALAPLALEIGRRRPVVLVYDEADRIIRNGQFKDGGQGGPLYTIANEGRWKRVALVGTTRRASRLGPDIPANAEGVFLMGLRGRADLAWVQNIGDAELRERVRRLPKFAGVMLDGDGYERPFTVTPAALKWTR